MAQTLFDKLWQQHHVKTLPSGEDLVAIDRVFLHERTGSIALSSLAETGYAPLRPHHVFCTMDHIVSMDNRRGDIDARMPGGQVFIKATRKYAQAAGIHLIDVLDHEQGIVHVIAPELGIAQPGLSIVCPDSHTCSLGALGALAWGIGSTDAEHAMVTGVLRLQKPRQMRIRIDGQLAPEVTAKDVILHIISQLGAGGGHRCAIEFCGTTVSDMDIESRLTLCNMAVEMAAFSALIAPDEKTYNYLKGRRFAPPDDDFAMAKEHWQTLASDATAQFDFEYHFKASNIRPMVSYGTSPEHALAIDGQVPDTNLSKDERKA
ncbi:MAG TPA: 3-isopropylmalate dehydratase, partial [Hellea balneolensis]|nr:3-isopropylmalate dehydratase [Hellea balneolensis]